MGRIPDDTLQAIRDRTDLVELIGRHVALKKAGRSYKGLCPFHHEKTPSFQVNPDRGIFHCFGCGESGNAFAFLMRVEGLSFPEAARTLAASAGIEIPESGRGEEAGILERVLEANAAAQALYRRALASDAGRDARAYLEKRGLAGRRDRDVRRRLRAERVGRAGERAPPPRTSRPRSVRAPACCASATAAATTTCCAAASRSRSRTRAAASSRSAGARWPPTRSRST